MNRSGESEASGRSRNGSFYHSAVPPKPRLNLWRRLKRESLGAFQVCLEAAKVSSLYVRQRNVTGTTILTYHSVADRERGRWIDPRNQMEPEPFEQQMRFLSIRRTPVSLSHLVRSLEQGRDLPPRTVVVTFDDGYLDQLTIAGPILKKYEIPATFFVSTGYVTRVQNPWVDQLYHAFRHRTRNVLFLDGHKPQTFNLAVPQEELEAFRRLEMRLLDGSPRDREAGLRIVEEQLVPAGSSPRLVMDWNDLRNLLSLSPGFEIGGHSRDHIDLSAHARETAARDISSCAEDLRRELGHDPRHFSYPYDRWTPQAQEEVRRCGFHSALGSGSDYLVTIRSDRFALPRIDAQNLGARFAFVTSGAYPGLSRLLTGRA
ncbi:MAG: polysaccharide deacetylase family protein [Planctomycetes bacterium]|nr:polysaccharide deacetylase family protein [Planctomycetota bacterium]